MNTIGNNDDYACIYSYVDEPYNSDDSKIEFYYGYEALSREPVDEDDENEGAEWCFTASLNGELLRKIPTSMLIQGSNNLDEDDPPYKFLIAGMYEYLGGLAI